MTGRLVAVCVGPVQTVTLHEKRKRTGILKQPVEGPVAVGELGLAGDGQGNRKYHGGPDKAVYAYCREYYAAWGGEHPYGYFGENLVLEGFLDASVHLGDRLAVGEVELEVTEPRTPCATLAWRVGDPQFVKRFAQSLRTGYYLRVVRTGSVKAGDPVALVQRGPGPSVEAAFVEAFFPRR